MKSLAVAIGSSLLILSLAAPAMATAPAHDDDDDAADDDEDGDKDDDDEGHKDKDRGEDDEDADEGDDEKADKDGDHEEKGDKDEGHKDKGDGDKGEEGEGAALDKWGHGGTVPSEPKKDVVSGEYRWDVHLLDFMTFGVGVVGNVGGNFLDKPDDQTVGGVESVKPDYPGFAGITSGAGPVFELRFIGYAGIELDILFQTDVGKAELEVTRTSGTTRETGTFDVEIRQSAVHVPLLFKGAIPGNIVTPVVFLGPEFVSPSDASAEIQGTKPAFHETEYKAKTPGGYTAFMFGLGLEFNLHIPYLDVRIPFQLRGSVNPGVSNERDGRADHEPPTPMGVTPQLDSVTYSTEWKFEAVANFGVVVHF